MARAPFVRTAACSSQPHLPFTAPPEGGRRNQHLVRTTAGAVVHHSQRLSRGGGAARAGGIVGANCQQAQPARVGVPFEVDGCSVRLRQASRLGAVGAGRRAGSSAHGRAPTCAHGVSADIPQAISPVLRPAAPPARPPKMVAWPAVKAGVGGGGGGGGGGEGEGERVGAGAGLTSCPGRPHARPDSPSTRKARLRAARILVRCCGLFGTLARVWSRLDHQDKSPEAPRMHRVAVQQAARALVRPHGDSRAPPLPPWPPSRLFRLLQRLPMRQRHAQSSAAAQANRMPPYRSLSRCSARPYPGAAGRLPQGPSPLPPWP